MRRREIVTLIGGAAAWPLLVRAQQLERTRHVAALMGGLAPDDIEGQAEIAAFEDGLKQAGWVIGRNIEIDYRWPGVDLDRMRAAAREIADTHPDLVLSRSTPATTALINTNLPVVFVLVADPVGSGFIQTLAKPGGNFTGFTNLEASVVGKWLFLLKDAAPTVTRIAVLFNPETAPYAEVFMRSTREAAHSLNVVTQPAPFTNDGDIETALTALAAKGGGGLIGLFDTSVNNRRDLIISLAARLRLPAIYPNHTFVASGGLMAYVIDYPDIF
jgi:putative tryptophan/tyrosine transport system substrate-binding protein